MTEEFLASHELEVKKLSLGSNGAIKQAARAGLGVSLQSQLTVALELELGLLAAVRPRDAALPERHWYLLRPANTRARPPVEQFVEFVHGRGGPAGSQEGTTRWGRRTASGRAAPSV